MRKQEQARYSGYRMPGIRMNEPMLEDVDSVYHEVQLVDLSPYHLFDKAHLVMLTEEGLIPREHGVAMLEALGEMEAEGFEELRRQVGGTSHSGEQYLIRRLGEEVGGHIHLGRSSGDLEAVRRRVQQRDWLIALMKGINNLRSALLVTATEHLHTVMPGYTHSQHAQPVTLGFQYLAWVCALTRDFERAAAAYGRVNVSPAGAAIMTGSNFALNRHRTAELMGFDGVLSNTFDAILNEEVALDSLLALTTVQLNLSKWAADLNFWYTSEAGFIDIPDRYCGTSSIMMQKKNPDLLEFIRGAVGETLGGFVTSVTVQKSASGDSTMDIFYMDRVLFRSFATAVNHLENFTGFISAVQVKAERMEVFAGRHWAQGTDVAGALVSDKGLPWRTAHQIVGILVRLAIERGIDPRDVTPELLDEAAREYMDEPVGLSAETLRKALDPVEFVRARTLFGGPAPEESERRIADYQDELVRDKETVSRLQANLARASDKLQAAIDSLLERSAGATHPN